ARFVPLADDDAAEARSTSLAPSPDANPEGFQAERRMIAELEAELGGMSLHLRPEHPLRAAHAARLAAAREELARQTEQARAGVAARREEERVRLLAVARSKLDSARKAEQALLQEIEGQTVQLLETDRHQSQYRLLAQTHETINGTYRSVMQRIEEVELAVATESKDSTVFVIDPAEVPTLAVSPNKRRSLSMAIVLGLAGGIGLCFLVDYLDRSLKTKEDVERILQLPVLGFAPAVDESEADLALNGPVELRAARDPRCHLAEAFRTIRTGVSFGVMGGTGERTRKLVVTSALPGDGKTMVALNLAIALAQLGKRVLLVDADMRRPRLSGLLGVDGVSPGLSTLLAGEEELARVDVAPRPVLECETLAVLPSGPVPPNPADLLNGERMSALLEACEQRFDWVILDAPPAALADPTILATHVKSVLFVVRSFRTPRELARRACQGIGAVGARVVGVVLNNVDLPAGGAAYGYGYGYGYGAYYRQDGESARKLPFTSRVLRRLGASRGPTEPPA
ncbi:MAG: polysaccharide biosynthesis tyrosine autokinase, partial [Planctomycetes bacterium]|nr:polysaccharide biosynthesis tyrosine autokinase [Planctomycetota bacterium]